MLDIKSEIKNLIKEALEKIGLPVPDIHLEHPDELSFGDFSTNVAMVLAKDRKQNPKFLAEDIRVKIAESEWIKKTEVAGPGFINFFLSKKFFKESIQNIDQNFGKSDIYEGKNILVEHSSPNLFKPFHIGHMMNNTIGESVVRLAEFSGAKVTRISFPSDVSIGIAKAIFIILEKLEKDENYKWDDIVVLGNSYVEGVKRYDEDESVHARVKEIADNLYSEKSSIELEIYRKAKDINMKYFAQVTERLGSKFDGYIYESEAGVVGKELVLKNTPSIFTESEGAIVYIPDEETKINTSVFINSQGNPTYEAKDLGLLKMKFEKYNPDISIFITDYQQAPHFAAVLDAGAKINKKWKDSSRHIPHGRMTFKGAKMSSRLGGVPLALDILETVREEVLEKMSEKDESISDKIANSAIKFTILKAEAGKNINFDPETSLSFEGDSGPYLQYTFARCKSLLEKANREGFVKKDTPENSWTPSELEKNLYKFSEIVEKSIANWAPHTVATYLLNLSRGFNSWYGNTKVLDKENENAGFYLTLVEKTATTIKNGLYLLGIDAPERM
ncbi:MAG: Arginine--tRNA ligase [Patescibacteria group bacterium]|jgi:arginyl-tRNA synthetase|nr:Arginine--tRNA ligase [Patescibacteria group bacterium]